MADKHRQKKGRHRPEGGRAVPKIPTPDRPPRPAGDHAIETAAGFPRPDENITELPRTLYWLLGVLSSACLLVFLVGLFYHDLRMIAVTVFGSATLIFPFILLRRRRLLASSWLLSFSVLCVLTLFATFGRGYHDLAVVAFPVILIFTSITMSRKILLINSCLIVASVSWLFFGEKYGLYAPVSGPSSAGADLVILVSVFLFLALTVDLLIRNMRANIRRTHDEIDLRVQMDAHDRLIAQVQSVLLRPCSLEDIYSLMSEKVHHLIGDCITATSLIDEENKTVRGVAFHGVDLPLKVMTILGLDPRKRTFPLANLGGEDFKSHRSGRLEILEDGLYALMARVVPRPACVLVEKLLGIRNVYVMGFARNDRPLGGLIILARSDISSHFLCIEQMVNIAAIAIERKLAERALRQSEEKFRLLSEKSIVGIHVVRDGRLVYVNPRMAEMFGFLPGEIIDRLELKDLVHPDDLASVIQRLQDRLRSAVENGRSVYRGLRKDGSIIFIEGFGMPIEYGEHPAVMETSIDVTDRKLMEDSLIESERKYRDIFNNATEGIFQTTVEGRYISCNPAVLALLGYDSEAEMIERTGGEASAVYAVPEERRRIVELLERDGAARDIEVRIRKKDQSLIWALVNVRAVKGEDGTIACFEGTLTDISERKRYEEALEKSEIRFRTAFMTGADAHVIGERESGRIIEINDRMLELYGYTREEFIGRTPIELGMWVDPEARKKMLERLRVDGRVQNLEVLARRKGGDSFWVLYSVNELKSDGPPLILAVIHDISERKKAELVLREQSALLELAGKAASFGGWSVDLVRNTGFMSDEVAAIHEIEPGSSSSWKDGMNYYAPEWREKIASVFGACAEKGISYDEEMEIITAKGNRRWVRTIGRPERDTDGKIIRVSGSFQDITERRLAENIILQREEEYRSTFENAAIGIANVGLDGRWLRVNQRFCGILGYSREELLEKSFQDLTPPEEVILDLRNRDRLLSREMQNYSREKQYIRKDGTRVWVKLTVVLLRDKAGVPQYFISIMEDISERKRTEDEREKLQMELTQAQKMESVGRLAGGVAHDFNNLLTVINGYARFLLDSLVVDDPRRVDVHEILGAGASAAELTRQLLAFSRRQILELQVIDINSIVGGMVKMLTRVIGEDVKLVTRLISRPCPVKVDAGQIEQVLMNLSVNARDAMPEGGTLTMETEFVTGDERFSSNHPTLARLPLVCVSVRDSGCGMTDEVKVKMFEPFFTTKGKEKGTGLGLAMVYGIIKQSGGDIEVESELGCGTIFRLYLPLAEFKTQETDKEKNGEIVLRGNETILFVEDEEMVRRLGERALAARGYTVLTAANGQEALEVVDRQHVPVDLLLTDVVMPGMSGRDVAREIARKKMCRRILYVSGYTDDAIVRHGVLEPGLAFLYKPFSPDSLARKVREVLDGPADLARV